MAVFRAIKYLCTVYHHPSCLYSVTNERMNCNSVVRDLQFHCARGNSVAAASSETHRGHKNGLKMK
jgi:hypothetical protein